MIRSEVWWVDFDPTVEGEIQKRRPAVIISNDAFNKHLNRLQVVPLTSNTTRLYGGEAYVMLNGKQHKALGNQLTTIGKARVLNRAGHLSALDMAEVERAVKTQLALS